MPFYKTLAKKQDEVKTRLIVASPDDVNTTKGYLEQNGVEFKDIRQANLSSINVRGTPTLLLVNDKGEVSNSWVGRLPSEKEKEVFSQL